MSWSGDREDIPIFYSCVGTHHWAYGGRKADWWGFTGRSEEPRSHEEELARRSRVYFTEEFLDELAWRHMDLPVPGDEERQQYRPIDNGPWTFVPTSWEETQDQGRHNWLIKHSGGYIWRLLCDHHVKGYTLGIWPD